MVLTHSTVSENLNSILKYIKKYQISAQCWYHFRIEFSSISMPFSASVFASNFSLFFHGKWLPNWWFWRPFLWLFDDLFRTPRKNSSGKHFGYLFGILLDSLWLPLGSLWLPLAPFGSLLAPFWLSLAPFGSLLPPFGALLPNLGLHFLTFGVFWRCFSSLSCTFDENLIKYHVSRYLSIKFPSFHMSAHHHNMDARAHMHAMLLPPVCFPAPPAPFVQGIRVGGTGRKASPINHP